MPRDSDKKRARSSLATRAQRPMSGVGSAFPQNQALAGVKDPEAAARAAADPAAARAAMEEAAEQEAKLAERRERIFAAYQNGLIFEGDGEGEIIEKLRSAKGRDLATWEAQVDQAERDQIDAEEMGIVQQAAQDFQIKPDDPAYQYMYDHGLRERIEEGLEPVDFGQMIFDGFAEQDITIRKGMVITFRTIGTLHALWLERRLHEASKMSEQYGRHWFSLLQLSVCMQRINGKEIGTDLNAFDQEDHNKPFWKALDARLKKVARLPTEVTDLLIAHMAWFSGRVRKELVGDLTEKVGNS